MQTSYAGPMAAYNSLTDEHLAGYFSSPLRRRHLRRMGIITRDGRIVDDAVLRMNVARKEHKQITKEALATTIVNKAVELERKRRAELKNKLELLVKYEQAEKVKHQKRHPSGVQDFNFNPNYTGKIPPPPPSWLSASLQTHCKTLGISSLTELADLQREAKKMSGARSIPTQHSTPYLSRSPTPIPRPPSTPKPNSASTVTRRRSTLRKRATVHSDVQLTLCFVGKSLRLDRWADSALSEVTVLQQHCGGNTVQLFKGKVQPKECFTFTSRRHLGMPFGLTIYLEGMIDCRVSACCEYKHQCGRMLGSKSAHFRMVKAEGGRPCYRCVAEREARQNPSRGAGLEKGEEVITDLEEPARLEMQFGKTHRVQKSRDKVGSVVEASSVPAGGQEVGGALPKNGHDCTSDQSWLRLPDTSSEISISSESGLPSSGSKPQFTSSSDTRVPHSQSDNYHPIPDEKPQYTGPASSHSVTTNTSVLLPHVTASSEKADGFDLRMEYSDDIFEDKGFNENAMEGDRNPSSVMVGSDEHLDQIPEVQPEISLAISDSETDLPTTARESLPIPASVDASTGVGPPSSTVEEKEVAITSHVQPPQASGVQSREGNAENGDQPFQEDFRADTNQGSSSTAAVLQQTLLQNGTEEESEKVEPQLTAISHSDPTLQHKPTEPQHDGDVKVIHESDTPHSILGTPERQKSSTMRSTVSVSSDSRVLKNNASDQELSEIESNLSDSHPGTPHPEEDEPIVTLEDAQNRLKSSPAYSLGSLHNEKESEYASTVEVSGSEDEDIPDSERKVSEINSQVGVRDSDNESEPETGTRVVSSPSRVSQDGTNIAGDIIVVTSPIHMQSGSEKEGEPPEQGESPKQGKSPEQVTSPEQGAEVQILVTLKESTTDTKAGRSRDEFMGHDKIVISEAFETPQSSSELNTLNGQLNNISESDDTNERSLTEVSSVSEECSEPPEDLRISEVIRPLPTESKQSESESPPQTVAKTETLS